MFQNNLALTRGMEAERLLHKRKDFPLYNMQNITMRKIFTAEGLRDKRSKILEDEPDLFCKHFFVKGNQISKPHATTTLG